MDSRFPEKLFYRIGDVAAITGIKPHVLRYWETEFDGLHPRKNRAGQRIYERRDLDLIIEIKTLLYDQRYTISGARKLLARLHQQSAKKVAPRRAKGDLSDALKQCREDLRGLLTLLQEESPEAIETRAEKRSSR